MAIRIDKGSLRPPRKTKTGVRVDGYLTRSGVFAYRNPDGSTRLEYRPPEEVFRADSLATFQFAPVTNDHPPSGLLDDSNAREHAVGSVGENIRRDGNFVAASLSVHDRATIDAMTAGKVQLSCGYECDIENKPGIAPSGERYDCVQRNIRGNHVALVDLARAGDEARVRLDASEMIEPAGAPGPNSREDKAMDLEQALAALTAANVRADKAEAARDAALAAQSTAEKARTDTADQIRTDARARLELEYDAFDVLHVDGEPEPKFDGQSDREIMMAVITRLDGAELTIPKGKTDVYVDAYVRARYDASMERADVALEVLNDTRAYTEVTRNDASGGKIDVAKARAAMINHNRNGWRAAQS